MDKRTFRWIAAGLYYGYPTCCIKSFVIRCNNNPGSLTPEQLAVNKSRGFVPCQQHSNEILAGKTSLEAIIKGRLCITPFPSDGPEVDFDLFIEDAKQFLKNKLSKNEAANLLF